MKVEVKLHVFLTSARDVSDQFLLSYHLEKKLLISITVETEYI
jgi:hypothetical protein